MIVGGVEVCFTENREDAIRMAQDIGVCRNCISFYKTLFSDMCAGYADNCSPFPVDSDDRCEEWHGRTKAINEWHDKLIDIYFRLDPNRQQDLKFWAQVKREMKQEQV